MTTFATKLEDGRTFEPVTWLADEVLRGIVKEPFYVRWDRWVNPAAAQTESAMISSNWDHAKLLVEAAHTPDPETLSGAAWQLGKLAATLTSQVVHLDSSPAKWFDEPQEFTNDILASTIKIVRKADKSPVRLRVENDDDTDLFASALLHITDLAKQVGRYPSATKHAEPLSEMSEKMAYLANATTGTWLDYVQQNDANFEMVPGGTPRSSGRIIKAKQAVFSLITKPW